MAGRRLSADEAALWRRVAATVTPMSGKAKLLAGGSPVMQAPPSSVRAELVEALPSASKGRAALRQAQGERKRVETLHTATLDASWDKKLARGLTAPDRTIDLHGHNLASAHALLDAELDRAVRRGDRVILLVTGRAPRPESERPHARGAIRAAIADWLASSRHSGAIAAVRGAHPRHGGAGALYVVLRRGR